jgi:hypothetical protein
MLSWADAPVSIRVYSGNRDAGRHLAAYGCTQGNPGPTTKPLVSGHLGR